MSRNVLRDVSDDVKAPFADATAGQVEGIVDGLDEGTKTSLARVVNYAFDNNLTAADFAEDMGCRTEVAEKLFSFVWAEV